jgi:hypothetical protein
MESKKCYVILRTDEYDVVNDHTIVIDVYVDEHRANYACATLKQQDAHMKQRSYRVVESLLHSS